MTPMQSKMGDDDESANVVVPGDQASPSYSSSRSKVDPSSPHAANIAV